MRITRLQIRNFRGIRALDIDVPVLMVLIGENNTGKTAVLDALRLSLREIRTRHGAIFEAYDFHLSDGNSDPVNADPIEITITFSESTAGEWIPNTLAALNAAGILVVDPNDGRGSVIFCVKGRYDADRMEFVHDWQFMDADGNQLRNTAKSLSVLHDQLTYFYLSALRDAARHFDPRGQYWRPFLRSSALSDTEKLEIEEALKAVNDQIVATHQGFDSARRRLRQIQDVLPPGSARDVHIEAVPSRIFDMLARTQVNVDSVSGAKIPIGRHGEGTQSLGVLMLFSAFLETWGQGFPIIGLEEPEAHLHPGAIRALWKLIDGLPGQRLISTHSGTLLSETSATMIRRLRSTDTGVSCHSLAGGTLDADQMRRFDYHVRYMRGDLLLAKCWLLVEGESESALLPTIASHLGLDMHRAGVQCVPYQQSDIATYLKSANDFGIAWCVLTDSDAEGQKNAAKVRHHLHGRTEADVLFVLPKGNLESYLCDCGFLQVYESYVTPAVSPRITAAPGSVAYADEVLAAIKGLRSYSKPGAAHEVARQICNGAGVPQLLRDALTAAVTLGQRG